MWKIGPNGELLRVSAEEANQAALQQSREAAFPEKYSPTTSGFMTPERKEYLENIDRQLTPEEAREWGTVSFDPSEGANMVFSMLAPGGPLEQLVAKGATKAVSKGVDLAKNYSKLREVPTQKLINHLERVGPRAMSEENAVLDRALASRAQEILDDMNFAEYMDEASYSKFLRDIEDLYTPSKGGTVPSSPEDFSDAVLEKLKKYGLEPTSAFPELKEDLIRQMSFRGPAFYNDQGGRVRVIKKAKAGMRVKKSNGDPPKGYKKGPDGYLTPIDFSEFHEETPQDSLFYISNPADRIARQLFMESGGEKDPNRAVSPAGAQGAWQIMPATQKDMEDRGLIPKGLDPFNPEHSRQMRDAKINALMKLPFIANPPQEIPEINRLARIYASYNFGEGNTMKALEKAKSEGVNIYGDPHLWMPYLPTETRNYLRYILFNEDKIR